MPRGNSEPLPDWIVDHLIEGDRRRAQERDEAYGKLTVREQRLCREFAVMGFVQGAMHAGRYGEYEIPKDSVIMAHTVGGLLSGPGGSFRVFRTLAGIEEQDEGAT